jgi:hypothetical protein
MQGAAGIGLFLAHLDAVHRHRKPVVRFPDEPIWEGLPMPNLDR